MNSFEANSFGMGNSLVKDRENHSCWWKSSYRHLIKHESLVEDEILWVECLPNEDPEKEIVEFFSNPCIANPNLIFEFEQKYLLGSKNTMHHTVIPASAFGKLSSRYECGMLTGIIQ